MTTNPPSPAVGDIEDLFKSIVWDNLTQAALAALYVDVPFLNTPVLSWFVSLVFNGIVNKIYSLLILFIDLNAIQLINAENQQAYDNATVELKLIAQQQGSGSAAYQEALTNAKTAFSKLISFH